MAACFWEEEKTRGTLINNSLGCLGLDSFREKTISYACLFLSRLKDILHLHDHSEISYKSLPISLTEMLE